MKNHIIISLLFLSFGFSQKEYNTNDVIKMDNGLWTVKFSDEPITGKVYGYFGEEGNLKKVYMGKVLNGKQEGKWVSYYHSTGRKMYELYYKNGKEDGLQTNWYENGQKWLEKNFKDGKEDGLSTHWYENGQKEEETTWKDGTLDGLSTIWYENGQNKFKGTTKDGTLDGLQTIWYENGKKSSEVNYKDGENDELQTEWYENGQKSIEINWKDGNPVSLIEWNEDGSVKKER